MVKPRRSAGLMVDLGPIPGEESLQALFAWLQALPEFEAGESRFGDFAGIPRVTEGRFRLSPRRSCSFYLKFEADAMGYPADIPHPTLMTLSLYGLNPAAGARAHRYLRQLVPALYACFPFRLAAIGEVTSFYINSQLVSEPWLRWQSHHLERVFLPEDHPFCRQRAGTKVKEAPLRAYLLERLPRAASENEDYKAFKAWLNAQAAAVQRL